MNERIRELADKVADIMPTGVYNLRYESGKRGVEFTEDALEKFAELIVRECINEVEGLQVLQSTLDWSQHWNRAIAHIALHLKEHFGVEE